MWENKAHGEKMITRRKQHSAQFKFKVAVEAVKGDQTRNQIASRHSVHPGQVSAWKKKLLTEGTQLFGRRPAREAAAQASRETDLYELKHRRVTAIGSAQDAVVAVLGSHFM